MRQFAPNNLAAMLVFVTGVAGSGKSTLCAHLRALGASAHDADEGISRHVRLPDGEPAGTPPRSEQTPEWAEAHEYQFDLGQVRELARASRSGTAFLLGAAYGDHAVMTIADRSFYLDLGEDELLARLAARGPGGYGSEPHEVESILAWHAAAAERYEALGAIRLDATLPARELAAGLLDPAGGEIQPARGPVA